LWQLRHGQLQTKKSLTNKDAHLAIYAADALYRYFSPFPWDAGGREALVGSGIACTVRRLCGPPAVGW